MLGLHDEHVAAVALGDDLILQVLRGLLATQIRLERAAQPRPLLAQPLANELQLGARVVDHLARRIDLVARLRDLALERRGAAARLLEQRKRAGDTANRGARLVDRFEKCRERSRRGASSAPALDRERVENRRQVARRPQREGAVSRDVRAVSVVAASNCATFCGSVDGGSRARRSSPIGVSAKPRTASTMRSNSRARRTPGCIEDGRLTARRGGNLYSNAVGAGG